MARKTIQQKKTEIKTWRAMYDGTCKGCWKEINAGRDLVTRHPEHGQIIHYSCHPDWVPAPFPGYDHSGRKKNER